MKKILVGSCLMCMLAILASCSEDSATISISVSESAESSITEANDSTSLPKESNCNAAEDIDYSVLPAEGRTLVRLYSPEHDVQINEPFVTLTGIQVEVKSIERVNDIETLQRNGWDIPPEIDEPNSNQNSEQPSSQYQMLLATVSLTNTTQEPQEIYTNKFLLVAYPKSAEDWIWQLEPIYQFPLDTAATDHHQYFKVTLEPGEEFETAIGFLLEDIATTYSPLYLSLRDSAFAEDDSLEMHDWFMPIA